MPIKMTEVRTVQVDYVCDRCDDGLMKSTGGAVYLTNPAQYPHRCTSCGFEQTFRGITYPHIGYEDIASKPTAEAEL